MRKCGKKHIENRSGIACCGADYPFGPSGSFRDIVSVPELRPVRRTSGKRLAVSQCAVLPACRPAVCRFAVGCLLLSFLRAERPGSVPPYPMRCAVRMSFAGCSSLRCPVFRVSAGAVLSRTAVNQKCSKPSKRRRCRSPRSSQTGPDCPSCEGVMRPTG